MAVGTGGKASRPESLGSGRGLDGLLLPRREVGTLVGGIGSDAWNCRPSTPVASTRGGSSKAAGRWLQPPELGLADPPWLAGVPVISLPIRMASKFTGGTLGIACLSRIASLACGRGDTPALKETGSVPTSKGITGGGLPRRACQLPTAALPPERSPADPPSLGSGAGVSGSSVTSKGALTSAAVVCPTLVLCGVNRLPESGSDGTAGK